MKRLVLLALSLASCTTTAVAPTTPAPLPCDADLRGYICCEPTLIEAVVARATKAEAMCAAADAGAK